MTELKKMSTAPRDGTEILAYHKYGKNFHPVAWTTYRDKIGHWGMRWSTEYSQDDLDYLGWVDYPTYKG